MKCQRCGSERIVSIMSKSSDCNSISVNEKITVGYVFRDMGIGGRLY